MSTHLLPLSPRPLLLPSSSSPPNSPILRPPSRSERLLRHTLRRDELALAHPSPPRHHRRHSTPIKRPPPHDPDRDPDYTRPSFLFRSAATPTSSPRHPRGVYGGDTEGRYSHSRPSSPTPSSRREHHDLPALVPPLTPHEQVLRARLERVLHAGRGVVRAESRERHRQQGRPRSSQSASDEGDEGWLWGEASSQCHPSGPKHQNQTQTQNQQQQQHQRSRSKTDPSRLTPPSPTTPPRSRSRSKSHSHSPSHSHSQSARDHHHHHQQHHQHQLQPEQHEPLTPPPTPPSPSTSLHNHLVSSSTPFNARTASARCRQMEGYVSFAAVEGLGEPPAGGEDDDPAPCGQGSAEDAKGRIFGRIWRVLGGEMVSR